jgi:hypothetical protein
MSRLAGAARLRILKRLLARSNSFTTDDRNHGGLGMNARSLIAVLATALVGAAASFVSPAEASDCGNSVLKAWDEGRLDSSFAPACYRKALQELPEDIRIYSSAQDDINRALIASVARQSRIRRTTQEGAVKGIVRTLASTAPTKAARERAVAAAADPNANTVPLTVVISAAGAVVLVGAAAISVVARRLRRHVAS